jgi:hypothetical protein
MNSRSAISGLDSPSPTRRSTSRSRRVSVPTHLGPVRATTPSERSNAAAASASLDAPNSENAASAERAVLLSAIAVGAHRESSR